MIFNCTPTSIRVAAFSVAVAFGAIENNSAANDRQREPVSVQPYVNQTNIEKKQSHRIRSAYQKSASSWTRAKIATFDELPEVNVEEILREDQTRANTNRSGKARRIGIERPIELRSTTLKTCQAKFVDCDHAGLVARDPFSRCDWYQSSLRRCCYPGGERSACIWIR